MKKKILLLSDDIRISSGIGTMSKSFVLNSLKDFDWVQMAGAVKHPESGKIISMSDAFAKETGIYFKEIGTVGGDSISINDTITSSMTDLKNTYFNRFKEVVEQDL